MPAGSVHSFGLSSTSKCCQSGGHWMRMFSALAPSSALPAAGCLCALLSLSAPAPANAQVSTLSGTWAGGGQVRLDDGRTERVSCRAYYTPRDGGSGLGLALRCASPSYKIELRSSLRIEGSKGVLQLEPGMRLRTTTAAGTSVVGIPRPTEAWLDPDYAIAQAAMVPCIRDLLGALRGEHPGETTGQDWSGGPASLRPWTSSSPPVPFPQPCSRRPPRRP